MAELIGNVFVYCIWVMIPILPLFVVLGFSLHYILLVRLDPILFKEPYFHKKELPVFSVWPFSMIKALMYILLITWPRLAKHKRFKGVDTPLPVGKGIFISCYIELILLGVICVASVILVTAGLLATLAAL